MYRKNIRTVIAFRLFGQFGLIYIILSFGHFKMILDLPTTPHSTNRDSLCDLPIWPRPPPHDKIVLLYYQPLYLAHDVTVRAQFLYLLLASLSPPSASELKMGTVFEMNLDFDVHEISKNSLQIVYKQMNAFSRHSARRVL